MGIEKNELGMMTRKQLHTYNLLCSIMQRVACCGVCRSCGMSGNTYVDFVGSFSELCETLDEIETEIYDTHKKLAGEK